MIDARAPVREEASFEDLVRTARSALREHYPRAVHDLVQSLQAWRATDRALSGRADLATLPALSDMRGQVARLIDKGFVAAAGADRLRDVARYLKAVAHRRERLDTQVARDRQLMDQIAAVQDAWEHAVAALPPDVAMPAHLREARWLLEEYRVSLWAQHLGTREKVSDQRIRKVLGNVG